MEKTKELLDERLIEEAAGKLHEAKHVFFYGVGDSAYFCEMMAKHLRCVGKRADFFVQRHDMLYNADRCGEKTSFLLSAHLERQSKCLRRWRLRSKTGRLSSV
ncbi:DNA-binding transcriptional repressor RpiR [Geobacillus sp. BCO2]|nr:DNA-binding transcriptional repressor RpiR [Geobacillus sp. BCO2]